MDGWVTRKRGIIVLRSVLAAAVALTLVLGAMRLALAQVVRPDEHAEVIGQGVAPLPSGDVVWRVSSGGAVRETNAQTMRRPLGFVFVPSGNVLVRDTATGQQQVLSDAEAAFQADGTQQYRQSLDQGSVTYLNMDLVARNDAGSLPGDDQVLATSDLFTAPSGSHDVNLVRDVLDPDESGDLPGTDVPTYIYVTDGTLTVTASDNTASTITAGNGALFTGPLTLRADRDNRTIYLAAVIGREVSPAPATSGPAQPAGSRAPRPSGSVPPLPSSPASTSASASASATSSTSASSSASTSPSSSSSASASPSSSASATPSSSTSPSTSASGSGSGSASPSASASNVGIMRVTLQDCPDATNTGCTVVDADPAGYIVGPDSANYSIAMAPMRDGKTYVWPSFPAGDLMGEHDFNTPPNFMVHATFTGPPPPYPSYFGVVAGGTTDLTINMYPTPSTMPSASSSASAMPSGSPDAGPSGIGLLKIMIQRCNDDTLNTCSYPTAPPTAMIVSQDGTQQTAVNTGDLTGSTYSWATFLTGVYNLTGFASSSEYTRTYVDGSVVPSVDPYEGQFVLHSGATVSIVVTVHPGTPPSPPASASAMPSASEITSPSEVPSASEMPSASGMPSEMPTDIPTDVPTEVPTDVPTEVPTDEPSSGG